MIRKWWLRLLLKYRTWRYSRLLRKLRIRYLYTLLDPEVARYSIHIDPSLRTIQYNESYAVHPVDTGGFQADNRSLIAKANRIGAKLPFGVVTTLRKKYVTIEGDIGFNRGTVGV